ncbi:hypothetical protein O1L60_11245 [Streptomyces diastatochromogenes]|nr:hypothetical protein [Streptomyces diastatochromogenes]
MFAYFTTTGLDVDVTGLRRAFPEIAWHGFADWARTHDWTSVRAPEPAAPSRVSRA